MRTAERDAAFTEFVLARQTHLRRIAYTICGDWNQAEDLLQTALAKLYAAWPRLRRDGREEAYVRQIIVRANIDEHRRPWRRERPGLDGHDPAAPTGLAVEDRSALIDALQDAPRDAAQGGGAAALARAVGRGDGQASSASRRAP